MASVSECGSLAGTAALVTGGDSALGLACARRLAADGAVVTICGTAERCLKESAGAYGLRYAVVDVTEEEAVADALAAAAASGPLRIVIASARGSASIGPVARLNTAGWRAPADVAEAARFLAGPESAWITGEVINVDGGQHLRRGPDYAAVFEPMFGAAALRGLPEEGP